MTDEIGDFDLEENEEITTEIKTGEEFDNTAHSVIQLSIEFNRAAGFYEWLNGGRGDIVIRNPRMSNTSNPTAAMFSYGF